MEHHAQMERHNLLWRLRCTEGHLRAVIHLLERGWDCEEVIGWMHPVLAEVAMATSSVTVVSNANRLRKVDIRPEYQREAEASDVSETAQRQPVRTGLQELR